MTMTFHVFQSDHTFTTTFEWFEQQSNNSHHFCRLSRNRSRKSESAWDVTFCQNVMQHHCQCQFVCYNFLSILTRSNGLLWFVIVLIILLLLLFLILLLLLLLLHVEHNNILSVVNAVAAAAMRAQPTLEGHREGRKRPIDVHENTAPIARSWKCFSITLSWRTAVNIQPAN